MQLFMVLVTQFWPVALLADVTQLFTVFLSINNSKKRLSLSKNVVLTMDDVYLSQTGGVEEK